MDILEAIRERHSVRRYNDKQIENDAIIALNKFISACNEESGLNMQIIQNEPKAFSGIIARYGKFSGVNNYIAVVGKKSNELDELCGYYGEKVVLFAQQLGLNTCWVVATYSKVKSAYTVNTGEKLSAVISIGYGLKNGRPHINRDIKELANITETSPEWFIKGVELALYAPTALNQQKFYLEQEGNVVKLSARRGVYTKIDKGIVKYHFEVGAGLDSFEWK